MIGKASRQEGDHRKPPALMLRGGAQRRVSKHARESDDVRAGWSVLRQAQDEVETSGLRVPRDINA
jgi:hypothetical protein